MNVVRRSGGPWREGNRPEWARTPSAGYFSLAEHDYIHDCHYHEFNEYYMIARGRGKIVVGDEFHYVQASDIACIKAGEEHDIVEVYGDDDLQLFYFYEWREDDGRLGHLHTSPEKARGHSVPRKALPEDFPPPAI